METKYAPAERLTIEKIEKQLQDVLSVTYVKELLEALPYIAAVLNENRQIVYANESVLKLLGFNCVEDFIGKRPGEILNCIHSTEMPGGCGTSENCKVCGAVNSILKSNKNNEKTVEECRISAIFDGKPISYDFQVSASPIQINNKTFTLLTINDISSDKRRRMLERIFFHDILNISGGIEGLVNLLKTVDNKNQLVEMISMTSEATHQLNEEIISHRELLAAENNELKTNPIYILSTDIIEIAIHSIKNHSVAKDKSIVKDDNCEEFTIYTDKALLVRVLVNMLKNALEAINKTATVRIGCYKVSDSCVFWIHNHSVIHNDAQLQIFQRSFSTKGSGRGLGTYSIKILTENYLQGRVWFLSNEEEGTTFFASIPL